MTLSEVGILVIDDVQSMRVQIKDTLKQLGFRKIVVAANGAEAKSMIDIENPQLILCDWYMEPVDGFELLKYVRSHPEHSKILFVMVTAESTREKVMSAVAGGVDGYILKPLTPQQVQDKVLTILFNKKVLA